MTPETGFSVLTTTIDSRKKAEKLAQRIVRSRLAACVQYMPIHSVYRWKGAIESTAEFMLVAKTRRSLVSPLIRFIQTVHPYEVPEIVATPITAGLAAYLHWIESETKQNKKKTGGVEKR